MYHTASLTASTDKDKDKTDRLSQSVCLEFFRPTSRYRQNRRAPVSGKRLRSLVPAWVIRNSQTGTDSVESFRNKRFAADGREAGGVSGGGGHGLEAGASS